MASTTYNHRKGSSFGAGMKASAEHRKCPACGRKSSLTRFENDIASGSVCRWDDCGYARGRLFGTGERFEEWPK